MKITNETDLEKLKIYLNQYFLSHGLEDLARHKRAIDLVQSDLLSNKATDKKELIAKIKTIQNQLINDLAIEKSSVFNEQYPSFYRTIQARILAIPTTKVVAQEAIHFTAADSDALLLKFGKFWKRVGLKARWSMTSFSNVFRKTKLEKTYPNRRVPCQNIYRYFYHYQLFNDLSAYLVLHENKLLDLLHQAENMLNPFLHKVDQEDQELPNFKEVLDGFDLLALNLKKAAYERLEKAHINCQNALALCGTLALNSSYFLAFINKRRLEKQALEFRNWTQRIQRNHQVVKDGWLLHLELSLFYNQLEQAYEKRFKRLEKKIEIHFFKQIGRIEAFVEESKYSTKDSYESKEDLLNQLQLEKNKILHQLSLKLVPECVRLILFQNLPGASIGLQNDFDSSLLSVSEKKTIKKHFKPDEKIRERDLSTISPKAVINFKYLNKLNDAKNELKEKLIEVNQKIEPQLIEISKIHSFTFESALKNCEESSTKISDVQDALKEGFERTQTKISELKTELSSLSQEAKASIKSALDELSENLVDLNNSNNAFALNVTLLEHIAKDKTISFLNKNIDRLKLFFNSIYRKIRHGFRRAFSLYEKTEKTLSAQHQDQMDEGIKKFLTAIESSYSHLPFIYQLLFKTLPLEDASFFVHRKEELDQLTTLYKEWQSGKPSNCLIIGSKGTGLTSLHIRFCQQLPDEMQRHLIAPKKHISSHDILIEELKTTFNQSKFSSINDVITYLNESAIKRVIVLDELQRFFLRHVGGFEILNTLQKLIRQTSKHVFWVVGLSDISAHYLQKTSLIHEFFSSIITLKSFDANQIRMLVEKRHEVSGFKLIYKEDITSQTKTLSKMTEAERQKELANIYFYKLHKSSNGSISLAMLTWVLSLKVMDQHQMVVQKITELKEELNGLNADKISLIHAILLHDGLDKQALLDTLHFSEAKTISILNTLQKNGVIVYRDSLICLNPVLFWQAIRLLTKKNLIH